jgi:EAL domain-containing protein (putative c-di-GMP-specific phosphodiesterase class I)
MIFSSGNVSKGACIIRMAQVNRIPLRPPCIEPASDVPSFRLFMQPIRPLHTGIPVSRRLSGELLMRIVESDGSLMPPGETIARRERDGTMLLLDLCVIHTAFGGIRDKAEISGRTCINISGLSISTPDFCSIVDDALYRTQTQPTAICFEITETAPITDMAIAAANAATLRERGIAVALDDFLTGYSNEGYLWALPVDYVKISGADTQALPLNTTIAAKVARICEVARRNGALTVAECVSHPAQLLFLQDMGIDMVQGDAVGPTVPA